MNKLLRHTAMAALSAAIVLTSACGGAETRKLKYEQKGAEYFAERNYTKAQLEYRNALQIDPKDAELRFRVGQVSEKLGSPRDAMGQYQAAIDLDPKHASARAAIARLYLLGGLTDKAMELVEPGLAQDPQNPDLLTAKAAAYTRLGNTEAAFQNAEAAYKIAPGNEYTVALLASLYQQAARSDKAIETVRAGLGKNPKSIDLHVILADLELKQDHAEKAEEALKQVVDLAPEDLANHYRLARFYLMRKDIGSAEKAVRGAVAVAPDKLEPKIALVDFLASQRGADQAEGELQRLIAKDPKNDELRLALGKFYESHGKQDAADKTYRAIIADLDKKPVGLSARDRLAALLLQRKDIAQAEKLIGEVLHENARDNDALVMRGNIALARGDTAAAIVDLRTVLRDQPSAVPVVRALARAHVQNNELSLAEEVLRSAVEQNPADADLRMDLAQLFLQEKKAEQARPLLEKLAGELPTNVGVLESLFRVQISQRDLDAARSTADTIKHVRPELGLGSYLAGLAEEAAQKPDAAVKEYERALELQPDAVEPLLAAVRLDISRKDVKKALDRLDAVIAKKPDNVVAQNAKGELLLSQGRVDDAVTAFSQAIEKAPQWWIPYRGLAYAQFSGKKPDAAVEALQRGVDKTNGAPALITELAALHERMGHPNDAIKVYEQAIARDPKSTLAANNLAMLLVSYKTDKQDLERAGQLVDKLANSSEPAMLDTRGWVKFKAGQAKEALPLLEQAVDKAPNAPILRYHLAMVQLKSGDKDKARKNLEAAIGTGNSFNGIDEARAALEEVKRNG